MLYHISQDIKNKEFKEKGSIDVTPYLDTSDGGKGYSPPLLSSSQFLIGISVTIMVLLLVIAKFRVVEGNSSSSSDELPISESTAVSNYSNQDESPQDKSLENPKNPSFFSKFRKLFLKSSQEKSNSQQIKTIEADEKD